jgi:serine/threonine protein kinase
MSATLLDCPVVVPSQAHRVPEPVGPPTDPDLRAHVERSLAATYELDREIGRGGMGIVYKAKDRRLKRSVAIKVLPPELAFRGEIRTRFLREAETAAQLSHPNIVPIYSVDERDGIVYFVMALVEGENLAVRLHTQGALSPGEARRILLEVTHALAYAHDRGVVHRDIKPDNILLQAGDGRVLVTDFGIARAVTEGADSRLTATGMAIGTPAYMSPEQSTGDRQIDGRSDLYSLGVVGYQMLTGDPPFEAPSTPAMLVKHLSERPEPIHTRRRGVPPDLERAVMLCLEKDPDLRFPSAAAMATALESGNVPELPDAPAPPVRASRTTARGASRQLEPLVDDDWGSGGISREEQARWQAPAVVKFRKKLGPYVIVNSVIIVSSILFGTSLVFFTALWSVYMAWQYAKLWSDDYDWHDVLREPHDRMFFDVVAEWFDNVRALWDKNKATEVRARNQAKMRPRGSNTYGAIAAATAPRPGRLASPEAARRAGIQSPSVRQAANHRDDILRWVATLSKRDKSIAADVPQTAHALYDNIVALAANVSTLDREVSPGAASEVESEIAALEAQANPFDERASEERVRRLAHLKRQRMMVADLEKRRERSREKLESCLLALENMRLDVIKLKAGSQTLQQVTLVAERARELASEVDNAMYVADEMAKLRGPAGGQRESGTGRR